MVVDGSMNMNVRLQQKKKSLVADMIKREVLQDAAGGILDARIVWKAFHGTEDSFVTGYWLGSQHGQIGRVARQRAQNTQGMVLHRAVIRELVHRGCERAYHAATKELACATVTREHGHNSGTLAGNGRACARRHALG